MEDIKALIASVSIVSFDIFDTAILRVVQNPVDLFLLVAEQFTQQTKKNITDFKKQRIQAEQNARDNAWNSDQRTEVTLDEIYNCLNKDFSVSVHDMQQLKQLELLTEQQCCVQNPYIYGLYQYCLQQGKKVIFTSDIYLPEDLIHNILLNAGYSDHSRLFVSSLSYKTKAAGSLYQYVIDSMDCEGKDILHLGDNYHSDVKMAKKYGLKTCYYEKCLDIANKDKYYKKQKKLLSAVPELDRSLYLAVIINKRYAHRPQPQSVKIKTGDFWYEQGYYNIGIFYLGFASWLISRLQNDAADKVCFLSRDGFIMQKVYEKLRNKGFQCPESQYLYASRRALNIASIQNLEDKDIDFLISGTSRISVQAFLERIGLDAGQYNEQCLQVGFSSSRQLVDTGQDYAQLRNLFYLLELPIKEIAQQESSVLHEYFEQQGLLTSKKLAIIDIGWHGSLQRSLQKLMLLMGAKSEIKGYYLGTFPPAQEIVNQGHFMSAFLCEQGEPDSLHQFIKQSVEIFEFIHGAPHGSLVKMEKQNGELRCVFDNDIDEQGKWKKIEQIQTGALDFIDDYLHGWSLLKHKVLSREMAIKALGQVLANPTRLEATHYGDLEHAEGYGDVYKKRFIAKPQNLLIKLLMPHKLIRDYRQSFWRKGFLKRCLFFW